MDLFFFPFVPILDSNPLKFGISFYLNDLTWLMYIIIFCVLFKFMWCCYVLYLILLQIIVTRYYVFKDYLCHDVNI